MKSQFLLTSVGRVSFLAVIGSILVAVAVLSNCGQSQPPPPPPALTIVPSSLPNLSTGDPVTIPLGVSGGVAPYHWGVGSGSLPQGLSLTFPSPNTAVAAIVGTPDTVAQNVNFTILATDSSNGSGSQPYKVSVLLGGDSLTFTPSPLDFAPQLLTTSSAQQTVTVTNVILSPINISSVVASSSEFAENTTCNSTLAAGASCTIGVVFTPAQTGLRSASITITDDTEGSPHSVTLNGTGVVAGTNATLSAGSMSFGAVADGDTSLPQSVSLTNYGMATLDVTGITASADFAETDDCKPLVSLATCAIQVTFSPTSTGNVSGTLSVGDNGPSSPQTVTLTGGGVSGKCESSGKACSALHQCCPGLQCVLSPNPPFPPEPMCQ